VNDPVELMRSWLGCFGEGDFESFAGTVSPDFVLRLPFVPAGVPNELRGREVVRAALSQHAKGRSKLSFDNVCIRRTDDPELVLTTCDGGAQMANGKAYRNSYVMLTRFRDGEAIEHIEYLNPLAVMEAM